MQRSIDRQEIDRLVQQHLPNALRMAWRLTGNHDQAEELVQQTLLQVLKRWRSYRGDAAFSTWLMSVMINAHRDRLRKLRREVPVHETLDDLVSSPHAGPLELAARSETAGLVLEEIRRLPPRQREITVVCLCEGLSPREAADVLGVSENNINVTLHAVRKRLARVIGLPAKEK